MSDSITESVRCKLTVRAERGLSKYGVSMERNDLTELQWLQHAQDELLDGAVYLEKLIQGTQHSVGAAMRAQQISMNDTRDLEQAPERV